MLYTHASMYPCLLRVPMLACPLRLVMLAQVHLTYYGPDRMLISWVTGQGQVRIARPLCSTPVIMNCRVYHPTTSSAPLVTFARTLSACLH